MQLAKSKGSGSQQISLRLARRAKQNSVAMPWTVEHVALLAGSGKVNLR